MMTKQAVEDDEFTNYNETQRHDLNKYTSEVEFKNRLYELLYILEVELESIKRWKVSDLDRILALTSLLGKLEADLYHDAATRITSDDWPFMIDQLHNGRNAFRRYVAAISGGSTAESELEWNNLLFWFDFSKFFSNRKLLIEVMSISRVRGAFSRGTSYTILCFTSGISLLIFDSFAIVKDLAIGVSGSMLGVGWAILREENIFASRSISGVLGPDEKDVIADYIHLFVGLWLGLIAFMVFKFVLNDGAISYFLSFLCGRYAFCLFPSTFAVEEFVEKLHVKGWTRRSD
jgi:hypothetical protein